MMTLIASILLAALSSSDAIATLLNSTNSCSVARYAEAREIVAREAKAGKPVQRFVMGVTSPDAAYAKEYCDAARPMIEGMAKSRNNALAWYLLSLEKNDMTALRRAAAGGNVQALNALGTILTQQALATKGLSSNDVTRLLKQSFKHFAQAAAQRDPNGFVNLGAAYTMGLGCGIDYAIAFECFRSAAEAGHPEAMDNLSACYDLGHGVPRDTSLSLWWRMKARAVRGDKSAERWLKEGK